jgi:hypothetical protein
VARTALPPQIERLDTLATLFLVTVDKGRALVVATVDQPHPTEDVIGEATIQDHDISDLIARLGCEKVWQVPTWASTPRIGPPEDVELLRYALGLPIGDDYPTESAPLPTGTWDQAAALMQHSAPVTTPVARAKTDPGLPPPPPPSSPEPARATLVPDDYAEQLRLEVFKNPASDARRRTYATRLLQIGDPRGELIIRQLERVRTGLTPTERERELVAVWGDACAEPLLQYLQRYDLRRGFVSKCVLSRFMRVPDAARDERAWATIEDIASTDAALLASPRLISARRARIDGETMTRLAQHVGLLPFEQVLPYPEPDARGVKLNPIDAQEWLTVIDGGAFMRMRALCIDGTLLGGRLEQLFQSRLGRRLAHLDTWIAAHSAPQWRAAFDKVELPLLTLRFAAHGIEPVIGFVRRDGAHQLVLELRATVSAEIAADLARRVTSVASGIDEIELVDTSGAMIPAQQPDLVAQLQLSFRRVVVTRGESLALI